MSDLPTQINTHLRFKELEAIAAECNLKLEMLSGSLWIQIFRLEIKGSIYAAETLDKAEAFLDGYRAGRYYDENQT